MVFLHYLDKSKRVENNGDNCALAGGILSEYPKDMWDINIC